MILILLMWKHAHGAQKLRKKKSHQTFSLLPTKSSMEACRGQSGHHHSLAKVPVYCTFCNHRKKICCTHLHEQPLLPQLLVEDENVRVGPDHAGVKVHDPKTLQAASPRQSDVRLAALKHTCQGDFHTVQRHPLMKPQQWRCQGPVAARPSCPPTPTQVRTERTPQSRYCLGHSFWTWI